MPVIPASVEVSADVAGKAEDAAQVRRLMTEFSAWRRLQEAYKISQRVPGLGLALAGIEGAAHSANAAFTGEREQWERNMGGAPSSRLGQLGFDTLRTFGNVGDAVLMGQTSRISDLLTKLVQ
jgi:hypothetical protein